MSRGRACEPRGPGRALWLTALVVPVLAGGWWVMAARGPSVDKLANLTAPGELVIFFGDSITEGYGVDPQRAFPALVSRELGLTSLNAGVPGDTTATALARLDRDVLSHAPRLTVVELGGNDFLRRVPLGETLENLDAILGRLGSAGSMVALLEINVGVLSDPYFAGYQDLAARHGALFVPDILKGILTDPALRVDAIHPNATGHQRIAARVAPALREFLRAADRTRTRSSRDAVHGGFPVAALPAHRVD